MQPDGALDKNSSFHLLLKSGSYERLVQQSRLSEKNVQDAPSGQRIDTRCQWPKHDPSSKIHNLWQTIHE